MSDTPLRPTPWDDIPLETVTDTIKRRLFSGERMMLAHVHLDKGAIVPMHSHENEQLTWIIEGALRFWIGEEGSDDFQTRYLATTCSYHKLFAPTQCTGTTGQVA